METRTTKRGEEPLTLDGIRLSPKDGDRRAWTYVPARPAVERSPSGAPQLQVIEAGPTAFLQCTARVALDEDARAALLSRLRSVEPDAETLEAAPLSVERIALEVKPESEWLVLAESKGSGMPPWNAALAATLAPAPLAALKSAIAGERGRARLTARIVLPGSTAASQRSESRSESRVETPAGTEWASFAATAVDASPRVAPTTLEIDADLSDQFPEGGHGR